MHRALQHAPKPLSKQTTDEQSQLVYVQGVVAAALLAAVAATVHVAVTVTDGSLVHEVIVP